jgi:hypothetical protein
MGFGQLRTVPAVKKQIHVGRKKRLAKRQARAVLGKKLTKLDQLLTEMRTDRKAHKWAGLTTKLFHARRVRSEFISSLPEFLGCPFESWYVRLNWLDKGLGDIDAALSSIKSRPMSRRANQG